MHSSNRGRVIFNQYILFLILAVWFVFNNSTRATAAELSLLPKIAECLDILMCDGTDHYGPTNAPILVSILDVESRQCPSNPAALDEAWRVVRRERRNPAGANLLTDLATLKTMDVLSQATGDAKYARFGDKYIGWYLNHLVDERGFIWWGWHRHYDVFTERMTGHLGNHHEIHAIHEIPWSRLWNVNSNAVRREIEAIWRLVWGIGCAKMRANGRRDTAAPAR